MKNQKGNALVVAVVAIALLGGAAYALVSRDVLKTFFATGDKPTQEEKKMAPLNADGNLTDSGKEDVIPAQYNPKEVVIDKKVAQPLVLSEAQLEFKMTEAQPVTFRWAGASESDTAVTYRLKVWQLMQGQSAASAMKENKPIVIMDVTGSEATVSDLYTGPCRPPYLCDFVWSADVVNKDTSGEVGTGDGTVEGGAIKTETPSN